MAMVGVLINTATMAGQSYNSSKMGSWIDTKKEADICASGNSCNVIFNNLISQPKLWIGKTYFDPKDPYNIAYDGSYSPKGMVGYIGTNWYSYGFPGYSEAPHTPWNKKLSWTERFDRLIVSTDSDDGGVIKESAPVGDVRDVAPFRHTVKIAHALQYNLAGSKESLLELKNALVTGAKGDYLTELKPAHFFYKHNEGYDYPGFAPTLGNFYSTILPLLEAHIVLQRNDLYGEQEFNLVHGWLEKRVWGLEQGVMDGTISKRWNYKPHQEAIDHEMIKKRIAYLLWGIADQNDEYFTAGVNGFKDAYTIIRNDGSLKTEHRKGSGNNFGLNTGNYVIQHIVNMAIILHHHGWDIPKSFPRIEQMVKFTSELVKSPRKNKYYKKTTNSQNSFNNSLEFIYDPKIDNTLAYVVIYDKTFGTKYSKNFSQDDDTHSLAIMGIVDAREIVIGDNKLHSINYKFPDMYPWTPSKSSKKDWSWFIGEKFQ